MQGAGIAEWPLVRGRLRLRTRFPARRQWHVCPSLSAGATEQAAADPAPVRFEPPDWVTRGPGCIADMRIEEMKALAQKRLNVADFSVGNRRYQVIYVLSQVLDCLWAVVPKPDVALKGGSKWHVVKVRSCGACNPPQVCDLVCVRTCVRACVRACVRVCVRARVRAWVRLASIVCVRGGSRREMLGQSLD